MHTRYPTSYKIFHTLTHIFHKRLSNTCTNRNYTKIYYRYNLFLDKTSIDYINNQYVLTRKNWRQKCRKASCGEIFFLVQYDKLWTILK